ncbi:MAG: glycoside hydrolase family 32 protein [Bryobacteraceae bacterium]
MRRREFLALAGAAPVAVAGVPPSKLASDPQRPQYHLMPAANWMNDPNGPIYWQGQYHMFYQYNPNGAFWGDMHWGHAVSPDMLHWKHLPMALAPTPGGPDKDGVFSGCAVIDKASVTAVYTGVNPEVQCIATSSGDLTTWQKYPRNPVIPGPPTGMEVAGFRDPAVWREGDMWLMALGSGFRGKGGAVLLYESPDLREWKYVHPLVAGRMRAGAADAKDPVGSGEMWECPDFFALGSKHVLVISTERVVKYFLGRYANRQFTPETEGRIDFGSYYAARTMTNTGGRRILWGWITEGRTVDAQKAAGWSGAMSLPRELSLEGSRLMMKPAAEVEKLRGRPLGDRPSGDGIEIRAEIDPGSAMQAGLKIRASADGREETLVYYDKQARMLVVDRARSSTDPSADGKNQSAPFYLGNNEPLRLNLFLDGSVVEIFANDRACLTARIYPTGAESTGIGLHSSGGAARLIAMHGWELKPVSRDRLTS